MRIVIDLQGAQAPGSRHRGIGRYSVALTKAILRNRGDHDVQLVLSGAFPDSVDELREVFGELLPQSAIHVWTPLTPCAQKEPGNRGRRKSSEDLRELFIRKLEPDVIHLSSLFEGMHDDVVCGIGQLYTDIPVSVSLFDLIPLIQKDVYLQNSLVATWYMERLDHLRRADACLAISESARQEAIIYLGMRPDQAINVGTAADSQFRQREIDAAEEKRLREIYGLDKPFVMYTGGIDFRKNIEALIRAYASIPASVRRKHQLAIICTVLDAERDHLMKLGEHAGLKPGELVMTGYVPEDDLIALYNLTTLFVFPSLHEGFGLPALEAMHCGAPVIASNRSSLPEVVQLEAALFDPYDEKAIASAITRALKDDEHRALLKANSAKQAKAFNWDDCGRRAIAAFEKLHAARPRLSPSVAGSRPRLAYVSPMPPARSGIATYTSELLPHLSRYYRIDAIVKDPEAGQVELSRAPFGAEIVSESAFRANAGAYDRILYQFGNSDHHEHMFDLLSETGGVVVLHDFFLSGILAHLEWTGQKPGAWAAELYRSHGYGALLFRKEAKEDVDALWRFPCSKSVVESADEVIVHSNYSLALAKEWYGDGLAKRFTIIPHLREPLSQTVDRSAARKTLGFKEDDFVVCSFGFVSPTKLSHKLVQAWDASTLKADDQCKLVFVGENHKGEYGQELERLIREVERKSEVSIAGWTDAETFRTYLAAADVAVQLRTLSRGETSGAVLDCMNFGVPLIVNANGSMADLSPAAAVILPEEFTIADLSGKLDELHANAALRARMATAATGVIAELHAPAACAEAYMKTIEQAAFEGSFPEQLIANVRENELAAEEVAQLCMELASISEKSRPRLLVDVSELAATDAGTGVQRVVRNILMQLLTGSHPTLRVEPIYTDPHTREFRFARKFTSDFLGVDIGGLGDDVVDISSADILLFLDLNPVGIPFLERKIAECKRRGTKCVYVVYDLLTVKHPEFFIPEADAYYRRWLKCVAQGTGALCISESVASDLRAFFNQNEWGEGLQIRHFPLGSDMDVHAEESEGLPDAARQLRLDFSKPTFLMVGTIEPRKKHADVLDAFEALWAKGEDINLCVVGKKGWMTEDVESRMARLDRREDRFVWKSSVSDAQLNALYERSTCLIAASVDEGYGLPLVEAAKRRLQLIARDIPVFREVCGSSATYFSENLTEVLTKWLADDRAGALPEVGKLKTYTWDESTDVLLREISSMHV